MPRIWQVPLQVIAYALFALCLGYFATMPPYSYGDRAMASVKISLSHATDRVKPCVQLTPEEIAELAANMRRTESCERERLPLVLELEVDGQPIISTRAEPSGLWGDGPARVYKRFDVDPGPHRITARLRDTARIDGWDYTRTEDVVLEAGRYFIVTFKTETGGFSFR